MQVQVETVSPIAKKISFEIPVEQVNSEIAKAYEGIQKRAKIQGFRPGKAPIQLIKRSYSGSMRDEVMRRFYEKTLFKALSEHKIEPVEAPTIESDVLEEGSAFKYCALVEVMPEIDLKDYTGLEITKERYTFDQQKIEDEIAQMRENMAQLVPVNDETAVETGFSVTIDYTSTVNGCPEETSTSENVIVEVGAHNLLPELEDQLVGMKCGETKQISLILPEDYHSLAAAGKEAVYQVVIKEIKRKELPELNDEFAKQFGDFETVEQLREKMSEYHRKHELDRIEHDQRERIIQALIDKNPIEVPPSLVKRQIDQMLENLKNRLKNRKMSIEMMGMDDESFRERFHDAAEDKVRGGLLLLALIKKEDFVVSDEEIEKRYEQIASGNPEMMERIKEHYSTNRAAQDSLNSELKEDKAIRFLLDNAKITETEPVSAGE